MSALSSLCRVRWANASGTLLLVVPLSVQACAEDICRDTAYYCRNGAGDGDSGGRGGGGSGGGSSSGSCDDNNDCNDGNECTTDACAGGSCESTPVGSGAPCAPDSVCNGHGNCVSLDCDANDGHCPQGYECAMGWCKLSIGSQCTTGASCASGFCADGVCCDGACGSYCESCNLGAASGTCTAVPMNDQDMDTCTGDHACDGEFGCKLASGQPCTQDGQCASDDCTGDNKCAQAP